MYCLPPRSTAESRDQLVVIQRVRRPTDPSDAGGHDAEPQAPYALQKLVREQYADVFARPFGMSVVSLRYFSVYGSGQPAEGQYRE